MTATAHFRSGLLRLFLLGGLLYAETPLKFHKANLHNPEQPLQTFLQWYPSTGNTQLGIASTDLNGDGIPEVFIRRCRQASGRRTVPECSVSLLNRTKAENGTPDWTFLISDQTATQVTLLDTATQGWRDLRLDRKLYAYQTPISYPPEYARAQHPGRPISSETPLGEKRMEIFGVAIPLDRHFGPIRQVEVRNARTGGCACARAEYGDGKRTLDLSIEASPLPTVQAYQKAAALGTDTPAPRLLDAGILHGHPLHAYDLEYGNRGREVLLAFDQPMYFVNPDDPGKDFFPLKIYISFSGTLLSKASRPELLRIYHDILQPIVNRIEITNLHTFAHESNETNRPPRLVQGLRSTKLPPVRHTAVSSMKSSETNPEKTVTDHKRKSKTRRLIPPNFRKVRGKIVWGEYRMTIPNGWYKNIKKSNKKKFYLSTLDPDNIEILILQTPPLQIREKKRPLVLDRFQNVFRNDRDYSNVVLYRNTNVSFLGDPHCAILTARLERQYYITFFLPYVDGAFHFVSVMTQHPGAKFSPALLTLLQNLRLRR